MLSEADSNVKIVDGKQIAEMKMWFSYEPLILLS